MRLPGLEDLENDVEAYAALSAALADPRADRGALLAARGLDEDAWDAIDDAWLARLSAADDNDDGVPPLVAAHAEAFARAQRARAGEVLPFERFAAAARQLARGTDLATALERLDLTLDAYLAAQAHWTREMLADDALAARFRKALA
jgi:hypothetical protein